MCYGYVFIYLHSNQNHCNHPHHHHFFGAIDVYLWGLLNLQSLMHYYYLFCLQFNKILLECAILKPQCCSVLCFMYFYVPHIVFFVVFFDYKFKSAIIIINGTWVRHPIKHRMQFNVFLFEKHTQSSDASVGESTRVLAS